MPNIERPKTWRDLLKRVIKDPYERQRIANTLNVNPVTLRRWIAGSTTPRQENLLPLLDALPQHRKLLTQLISEEYPHLLTDGGSKSDNATEIASALYAQVMHIFTTSPSIVCSATLSDLILRQMLEYLDPQQLGMVVAIMNCLPPAPDQKVRSLLCTNIHTTLNTPIELENQTQLFGAESQMGQAITAGHICVIQGSAVKFQSFDNYIAPIEAGSICSCPIMLSGRAAGCVHIISTQQNYFTQATIEAISNFVNILVITFAEDEYYDLSSISLGIMPPRQQQFPLLATFQQRVTQLLLQSAQRHQLMTRFQAEVHIWKALEEDLLYQTHHSS